MEVSEIKKAARDGERPEGVMTPYQELLWYKLRELYALHGFGRIREEEYTRKKQQLFAEYRANETRQHFGDTIREENAKRWQRMEHMVNDYRKNKSIEKADRILDTLYGLEKNNNA